MDERWKGDLVKKLQGPPARPDPNRGHLMIRVRFDPPQVGEPDPTMQPRKEPQTRRMKITESMLQKFGYTEGCEGCRAKAASMTQKPHGEACRKRIEQALDGDEAGRELRRKDTERGEPEDRGKDGEGSRQNHWRKNPRRRKPQQPAPEVPGGDDAGGGNHCDENPGGPWRMRKQKPRGPE